MDVINEDFLLYILASTLKYSCQDSRNHCHFLSSKWLSEQLIGLKKSKPIKKVANTLLPDDVEDIVLLAQNLINQGEYQRSAHLLKKSTLDSSLSRYLYYYSIYMSGEKIRNETITSKSAYVDTSTDKKTLPSNTSNNIPKNPYLKDLFDELYPYIVQFLSNMHLDSSHDSNNADQSYPYKENHNPLNKNHVLPEDDSDNNTTTTTMNGYLFHLFSVVTRDLYKQGGSSILLTLTPKYSPPISNITNTTTATSKITTATTNDNLLKSGLTLDSYHNEILHYSYQNCPSIFTLFLCSLRLNPFNWSCWLDFMNFCVTYSITPPPWSDIFHIFPHSTMTNNLENQNQSVYNASRRVNSSPNKWKDNYLFPLLYPKYFQSLVQSTSTNSDRPPSTTSTITTTTALSVSSELIMKCMDICGMTMYRCFLSQYYIELQLGDKALQVLDHLVLLFPDSQVIASQVALAHYSLRDYDKAQEIFQSMKDHDPYRMDYIGKVNMIYLCFTSMTKLIDTFSNILYVQERKAELSHLAHTIVKIDKYSPETCCVIGNYYSIKSQHEKAILYFQRALRVNVSFLSAWTLMGHEYLELRNTSAAIDSYRHAVEISKTDYRAWYGLGQTYEMLHLYQYALYYYKKAAMLKSNDARMWCAVGNCYTKLGMKEEAILSLDRAVSSGDREGIATRELARLYRESGQMDLAAECYRRHIQATTTTNTNTFSSTLITPTSTPMDIREETNMYLSKSFDHEKSIGGDPHLTQDIISHYLSPSAELMDAERAEGVLFLATYYRSLGEYNLAEVYGTRLMDYIGPEGDEARALLREIRSLSLPSLKHNHNKQQSGLQKKGIHLKQSPSLPHQQVYDSINVTMGIQPIVANNRNRSNMNTLNTSINMHSGILNVPAAVSQGNSVFTPIPDQRLTNNTGGNTSMFSPEYSRLSRHNVRYSTDTSESGSGGMNMSISLSTTTPGTIHGDINNTTLQTSYTSATPNTTLRSSLLSPDSTTIQSDGRLDRRIEMGSRDSPFINNMYRRGRRITPTSTTTIHSPSTRQQSQQQQQQGRQQVYDVNVEEELDNEMIQHAIQQHDDFSMIIDDSTAAAAVLSSTPSQLMRRSQQRETEMDESQVQSPQRSNGMTTRSRQRRM